jgi:two-component system, OmpR family, KDP operon response regulator KdpE
LGGKTVGRRHNRVDRPPSSVSRPVAASGPRILIVDDDQSIRRLLEIALRARGYTVFEADTAQAALNAAPSVRPDVVILDLGLPDRDGFEIIPHLQHEGPLRILVLSVRDREEEKVRALEAGADDYLTKPFGIDELHARLRVVLRRRAPGPNGTPFRTGALEVDLMCRLVKVAGEPVQLTPTEYEILKALVHAGGAVLTHKQLLRQVWGAGYEREAHLLQVNISTLRRKLERPPDLATILTEPRIGYRLRVDSN